MQVDKKIQLSTGKKLKNVDKQTYPLSYPHYPQWKNKGKEWKNIVNIKHLFCAIF